MKSDNSSGLVLGSRIASSFPQGFGSYTVVGRRGIGKSSYAMKCLHEALLLLGYSDSDAWDITLDSVRFTIPDVVNYIDDAIKRKTKKVCLIWDDTRIYGSGSAYFLHMKLVNKLGGMLDSIRTRICTIILTCPSPEGLLGILKSYDDYFVKISYDDSGGFNRVANGYLWSVLPSGQRRIYKKFQDFYSCYLPKDVYDRYTVMRESALDSVVRDLNKIVKDEGSNL